MNKLAMPLMAVSLGTIFATTSINAASVEVTYQLSIDYYQTAVGYPDSAIYDYFGDSASAVVNYDLDTTGRVYSDSSPFIMFYENAITSYSFSTTNTSTGLGFSVTGAGSDIQIQNDIGGTIGKDRFRVAYEYTGSTDHPDFQSSNQIGVEIDQLYSSDPFTDGDLPNPFPVALGETWNQFRVFFDSNGIGANYEITSVSSVTTVPVPAAAWLFGSGLLGLIGIARRKKAA